jgi:hypothetical protein
MMQNNVKLIAKITTIFLLVLGAAMRIIWGLGGPDWTYWFGNLMLATFLIIPGIGIIINPSFTLELMQSFGGPARNLQYSSWSRIKYSQKFKIYVLAFVDLIVGGIILFSNVSRLIGGSSP